MKKRTKLLSVLTAGVMAVGVMCYGFAQWSTEINASGTVSANGKWDVAITDAAITNVSGGTAVDTAAVTSEPTGTAVVYDVVLKYVGGVNDPGFKPNGAYMYTIDDTNPRTIELTQAEYDEYTAYVSVPRDKRYYTSATVPGASGLVSYQIKVNEPDLASYRTGKILDTTTYSLHLNDDGANEGVVLGKAIAWAIGGSLTADSGDIQLTYRSAAEEIATGESVTTYPAEFTDTEAAYADVAFSLNGAWAEYKLTVTNRGTVNANLSDYKFDFTALDDEIYTVDTPDLTNETLAPNESCTLTFVVKVDTDKAEITSDAQSFKVTLNYVQDEVSDAPAASHTHN